MKLSDLPHPPSSSRAATLHRHNQNTRYLVYERGCFPRIQGYTRTRLCRMYRDPFVSESECNSTRRWRRLDTLLLLAWNVKSFKSSCAWVFWVWSPVRPNWSTAGKLRVFGRCLVVAPG